MGDHLVVNELVALGHHHEPIEREQLPERIGLEHLDVLERALPAVEHVVDTEGNTGVTLPVFGMLKLVMFGIRHEFWGIRMIVWNQMSFMVSAQLEWCRK
jgi:hypothetical protein